MGSYRRDLAYINDAGFSDFNELTAPGVVELLRHGGVTGGLAVDMGCGGGRLAAALCEAGYDVLGIDLSPEMLALARGRAPGARFAEGSLVDAALPACDAVTAVGEVVNYRFDRRHSRAALSRFFRRVHAALRPGGMFLFDVAGPDRVPEGAPVNYWKEGTDWAIHVEVDGDAERRRMTRRIVCFRDDGAGCYRRSEETHRLLLLDAGEVAEELRGMGFSVRERAGYGRKPLYPGMRAIISRKR